jgi:hypothetical protein
VHRRAPLGALLRAGVGRVRVPRLGWAAARFSVRGSTLTWQDVDLGLPTPVFGRRRFAFHDGGLVDVGEADPGELSVDQAIDVPGLVQEISFNSRDDDVLLVRTGDSLRAWNVPLREGRRLRRESGPGKVYFDWPRGAVVRFGVSEAERESLAGDPTVRQSLRRDDPARFLNALWDLVAFPIDAAWAWPAARSAGKGTRGPNQTSPGRTPRSRPVQAPPSG